MSKGQLERVSLAQARGLKAARFGLLVTAFYGSAGLHGHCGPHDANAGPGYYSAPTVALALK
ncbi:MAG: hypothetical protein FWG50_07155 [Kiritimatiellaeota bacterium]|nr:hypothetical protein [Kiritimatiellota bacterium]